MIEVAVFGAGRIGKIHAANVARHPQAKLKYVVDTHAPSAEALADELGAKVVSVEEALNDPAIGAVVIGSSTDTHADLILRSAAAGKAIFCEKPVDLDVQRARECEAAVNNAGVVCMVGFQRRFDPTFAALKARLEAGEIGEAEMLVITSRDPSPPPVSYIERSGGVFKDMLIHDFDIFRWILGGEAVSVYATGGSLGFPEVAAAGDITQAVVTIRTKSGSLCQINTSRRAAYGYDQRFEVLGSAGMLQCGNHRPSEVVQSDASGVHADKPEHFFLQRYREAYRLELAHFFETLQSGGTFRTTIADGVAAQRLADAASESLKSGQAIRF